MSAYGDSRLYRSRRPGAGLPDARGRRHGLRVSVQPLPRRDPPQRLGGTNDADDLLQETFIKVYINLHRYSTSYTFGQWVYTIARNTFIDFVRRRQEDLPIDDRFTSPASSAPTPEESVINLQQRTQIEHYLERLTPRYRQLILMRFFEEYSYEEIAAKLSLPLGTVKTQIHRAREQMCRLIAQGDER